MSDLNSIGDSITLYGAVATVAAITLGAQVAVVLPLVGTSHTRRHEYSELTRDKNIHRGEGDIRRAGERALKSAKWNAAVFSVLALATLLGWAIECHDLMVGHAGLALTFAGAAGVLVVIWGSIVAEVLGWRRARPLEKVA